MSEQAKPVCVRCGLAGADTAASGTGSLTYGGVSALAVTSWQHRDCITALRAALDQERARIRELAESPPLASISLCCGIVRPGHYDEGAMHNGLCRGRHGGELGKTYYLHDVSALLSGRGEAGK